MTKPCCGEGYKFLTIIRTTVWYRAGGRIWPGKHRSTADACGAVRRGRTRQAAKGRGEGHIPIDPRMSEWGNPHAAGHAPQGMNKIVPRGHTG